MSEAASVGGAALCRVARLVGGALEIASDKRGGEKKRLEPFKRETMLESWRRVRQR